MNATATAAAPARIELLNSGDDRYAIESDVEILSILRAVRSRNALTTVYLGNGTDSFVTTLLDVGPATGLVYDCAPSVALNERTIDSSKLVFVTTHDRVQIHFACARAFAAMQGGKPALRSPLPKRLLRLQRRDFFRLTTPVLNPLKCVVSVHRNGKLHRVALRVLDLSCGGIATGCGSDGLLLDPGTHYPCTLELPDTGVVQASVAVRNTFEVTLANGSRSHRLGCEFIALPEKVLALIQRYILQQQRARRVKLSGLR